MQCRGYNLIAHRVSISFDNPMPTRISEYTRTCNWSRTVRKGRCNIVSKRCWILDRWPEVLEFVSNLVLSDLDRVVSFRVDNLLILECRLVRILFCMVQ